jgi:hypothetical protein
LVFYSAKIMAIFNRFQYPIHHYPALKLLV